MASEIDRLLGECGADEVVLVLYDEAGSARVPPKVVPLTDPMVALANLPAKSSPLGKYLVEIRDLPEPPYAANDADEDPPVSEATASEMVPTSSARGRALQAWSRVRGGSTHDDP